jgi:hypothetical protein
MRAAGKGYKRDEDDSDPNAGPGCIGWWDAVDHDFVCDENVIDILWSLYSWINQMIKGETDL